MPRDRLDTLCAALERTAERPLDRSANRWLGEAQAVATDLRNGDPDPAVLQDRLGTLADLLDNVEATGDEQADAALDEALDALVALRQELEDD
ncbi:MAG: hypothetical protein V5A18_06800 [Haloarculaceae archaeon]